MKLCHVGNTGSDKLLLDKIRRDCVSVGARDMGQGGDESQILARGFCLWGG
jgi:hypothetical protein